MAKHVLTDASVVLNSVDLSDHVDTVSFVVTIVGQPASAMADVEDYSMPGLRKISPITLTMYQDFAASKTYATLMTLWTNRTSFNCVIKPTSGAAASTNPQFTVSVFISSFPVVAAKHGDAHMSNITLEPAGIMTISAP